MSRLTTYPRVPLHERTPRAKLLKFDGNFFDFIFSGKLEERCPIRQVTLTFATSFHKSKLHCDTFTKTKIYKVFNTYKHINKNMQIYNIKKNYLDFINNECNLVQFQLTLENIGLRNITDPRIYEELTFTNGSSNPWSLDPIRKLK